MDAQHTNSYKEKLEKEKSELFVEIKKRELPEDFGERVGHADELSDEVEETASRLVEIQAFKDRINEIDSALIKINHGTYGVCEKCGETIEEQRLAVDPATRTCMRCL